MDDKERRVQLGVQLLGDGLVLRDAAKLSGAPKETIRTRAKGVSSRAEMPSHGPQRLSEVEEASLKDYILSMDASGFPLRQADVEHSAATLLVSRGKGTPLPLGEKWFSRFIERHAELAFRTKEHLSRERSKGLSKENAERFFRILGHLVEQYGLTANSIFSMDETGVQHGTNSKSFKFATSSKPRSETVTAKEDGTQELTTIIESICANGAAVPPAFIFKGKMFDLTLTLEAQEVASFTSSPTGWTNALIAQSWFAKVFVPWSQEISMQSEHRVLIMDGHKSHFTLEMLKLARANNIHILSLPAHSTHGLAPLDRTCFAPVKTAWAEEQRREFRWTGMTRREDVVRLYEAARQKGLTPKNIVSGYAATGIWPLRGIGAIPEAMFTRPKLTEAEAKELEDDTFGNDRLAEALSDMVPQVRSQKGKAVLHEASLRLRRAAADTVLFADTMDQMRGHAATLKAKPRAFRVAEEGYGQAKLWTQEEAIQRMEEERQKKAEEEAEKERTRLQKEADRETKRLLEEEQKKVREQKELERLAKKAREAQEKAERAELRQKRKAEKELEAANRALNKKPRKPRKSAAPKAPSIPKSPVLPPNNTPSNPQPCHPLQPTQLVNE